MTKTKKQTRHAATVASGGSVLNIHLDPDTTAGLARIVSSTGETKTDAVCRLIRRAAARVHP